MRNLIKFNSHSLSMRRCYLSSKLDSFDVVRHKRGLGKINYGFHRSKFIYSFFLFFLYRQLLPPFYDIRIFTYFRSMSCYRIINFAKLPLTKCHKIIMRKYNRNKVRLLREILIKMIAWIMSYKHHFVFCFQIIEFDNIKYRLPSCT